MRTIRDIDPTDLERIYKEVTDLRRNKGLSYNKIKKIVEEKYGIKISKATIIRWVNNKANPFNRMKFISIKPCPELSYVIGAFLGDGNAYFEKGKYNYRVKLKVRDREFAVEFKTCLEKLGYHPLFYFERNATRTDRWVVEVRNKHLFFFLKKPLEELVKIAKDHPKEFIRGFFDAEGGPLISTSNGLKLYIHVSNTDKKLLEYIREMLKNLGISSEIKLLFKKGRKAYSRGRGFVTANKDLYVLLIRNLEDVYKFYNEIGLTIKRKQEKLAYALYLLLKYDPKTALKKFKERFVKIGREYKCLS